MVVLDKDLKAIVDKVFIELKKEFKPLDKERPDVNKDLADVLSQVDRGGMVGKLK